MDYYVGEIRLFAGMFAPVGWNFCDGTAVTIADYQALFAVIGTLYGGNSTTFNLPDLRSRVPIGQGTGNGLTPRTIGQSGGAETVTLTSANLPAHTHSLMAVDTPATAQSPTGALPATLSGRVFYAQNPAPPAPPSNVVQLDPRVMGMAYGYPGGTNAAHLNIMPSLGLNYIIAMNGLFPSRN